MTFSKIGNMPDAGARTHVPPWSFDVFGKMASGEVAEAFMAVDYDIFTHIVRANAAIGLHRRHDNQELFMVIGNRDDRMVSVTGARCPTASAASRCAR